MVKEGKCLWWRWEHVCGSIEGKGGMVGGIELQGVSQGHHETQFPRREAQVARRKIAVNKTRGFYQDQVK